VSMTTIQAILSCCTVRYYNPYLPNGRGRFGGMELLKFPTCENNRIPVPEQLWEIMQRAPTDIFRSRTLCITDLSPAIAAILIASTPRCAAEPPLPPVIPINFVPIMTKICRIQPLALHRAISFILELRKGLPSEHQSSANRRRSCFFFLTKKGLSS
jgi:hypothetical protein